MDSPNPVTQRARHAVFANRTNKASMPRGCYPAADLHLVLQGAALQGSRGEMPALFQKAPSLQSYVAGCICSILFKVRMVRVVSSGDEPAV